MSSSLFLTILQAIIPILVTLGFGYMAAWRRDFDAHQAGVLIRLVMLYALPLALFVSILSIPRTDILTAGPLAFLILLAMVGGYLLIFLLLRAPLKRSQGEAALMALTMTGPSVPFIGIPVLGQLFGPASAVPISIASLAMNLFQVPLTLILLSHDQQRRTAPRHVSSTRSLHTTVKELSNHLLHSCREPVVWVPLLALCLVIAGVKIPTFLKSSFTLLGHATGGTALFASGVVLFARQVRLSPLVAGMVSVRNLVIPLSLYGAARLLHIPPVSLQESVLTMAIPSASINVILAMRYHLLEREVASALFFGTLSALFTMASFIWLTHS